MCVRQSAEAPAFDYLKDEFARRMVDRIRDIKRSFPDAADVGCNAGHVVKALEDAGSVQRLVQLDFSEEMLKRADPHGQAWAAEAPGRSVHSMVADEEWLPLPKQSQDMIISSMNMHWVNDLPSMLGQCRDALKPDGVFLACMLGGDTLQELRSAFAVADTERLGGVSPHISPFAKNTDCGNLLSGAGFAIPTVDVDTVTVRYPDMYTLCEHLRGMGETNASLSRLPYVSRDVFNAAAAAYQELYADEDGLIPATFQVLYMIGWSPHSSQQKPKARGSATSKIGDLDPELQALLNDALPQTEGGVSLTQEQLEQKAAELKDNDSKP